MAFGGGNVVKSISDGELERRETGKRKPKIPSERLKPTREKRTQNPYYDAIYRGFDVQGWLRGRAACREPTGILRATKVLLSPICLSPFSLRNHKVFYTKRTQKKKKNLFTWPECLGLPMRLNKTLHHHSWSIYRANDHVILTCIFLVLLFLGLIHGLVLKVYLFSHFDT